MKYGELNLGQVEAIVNKLGGMNGVHRFLSGELAVREVGQVIKIDRSQPFDPVKFLDKGWSIVEEDERSLALTEVDLTKVRLETMLRDGETNIRGEEHLKMLKKAGCVRLDAKVFQTLWENQGLIPESWKERINGNILNIHFTGTELLRPEGSRCVLSLYWYYGHWPWNGRWLGRDWNVYDLSVVLVSI